MVQKFLKKNQNSNGSVSSNPSTDNPDLKRQIKFTVPLEEVQKGFRESYKKVQKNTKITGFRPGKAPVEALRQSHYDTVWQRTAEKLFNRFYPKAIKENHLNPAGQPVISKIELEENKEGLFEVQMEVHPKITVKNYLKLPVKKENFPVTHEQIDQALKQLQNNCKGYKDTEKTEPLNQDLLGVFSMEAWFNKKKFKPLCHSNAAIHMGKYHLAPGFDDHLLGMKPEELREFSFSFPKNHNNKQIAGKTFSFKMQLKKIKKETIPELNDQFAGLFKMKTLTELKEKIKKDLEKENEKKSKRHLENAVLSELIKQNPLPLPENLVEEEKKKLIRNLKQQFELYKIPKENMEAHLEKEKEHIERQAKRNLHIGYLIEALIDDLKIQATPDDRERFLKAAFPSLSLQEAEKKLRSKGQWENHIFQANFQKAIDYLVEQAEIL